MSPDRRLSILVLQVDNRTSGPNCGSCDSKGYWNWTIRFNASICRMKGWHYCFLNYQPESSHSAHWLKSFAILKNRQMFANYDLVLYLDTDAWIRDTFELESMLVAFTQSNDKALFSADVPGGCRVNTGVFCFRPREEFIFTVLSSAVNESTANVSLQCYRRERLYDQSVINAILQRRAFQSIAIAPRGKTALNGSVICHCWEKHRIRTLVKQDAERLGIILTGLHLY